MPPRRWGKLQPMADSAFRELSDRCSALQARVESVFLGLALAGEDAPTTLRDALGDPPDLVERKVGRVRLLYLSTIVHLPRIEEAVIHPLTTASAASAATAETPVAETFASHGSALRTFQDAVDALLGGKVVLLMRDQAGGYALPVTNWPKREIAEPAAEFIARGPHLGFIEDLDTNIALLRQGIHDRRLRWEHIPTGQRSGTRGALVYMEGLVPPRILQKARRHLAWSRPSFTTDSAMLGQWLVPRSGLFLPTVGSTERPDRAVAALLEGRVLLLASGSPTALLVPNVFAHLLQVPEDYYQSPIYTLMNRLVRVLGMIVASLASPLLVALTTLNHDLIPTRLFLAIAQSRRAVPVPIALEVLTLEVTVEVIREAGVRLPSPVGQSVSIIGAVVIGQSALMAGLVSAPVLVVVALAFIASFVLPSSTLVVAVRAMRYPLILLAAALGLYGLTLGLLLDLIYLCALDSFGVPYLAPLVPLRARGLQDTLWRRTLPALRRAFYARDTGEGGTD